MRNTCMAAASCQGVRGVLATDSQVEASDLLLELELATSSAVACCTFTERDTHRGQSGAGGTSAVGLCCTSKLRGVSQ